MDVHACITVLSCTIIHWAVWYQKKNNEGLSRLASALVTGPNSVGKETQNRNKFNAFSLPLFSPLPSSPFVPAIPASPSFVFYPLPQSESSLSIPPTPKSQMLLTSLAFLLYASALALAQQIVYDSAHNVTPITGTWSSGSMNVVTGSVRMFVFLLWHLLITGKWCSNSFLLTTRASHTPKLRAFLLHCAFISRFVYRKPKMLRYCFPSFFFFSNEALGWFEVLRYRMNGNGASLASLRP